MNDKINELMDQMKEIQNGKPWIGSSFSKKINLIEDLDFFRRPMKNMHSVAEIISHLTAWRIEVALKIDTGKGKLTDDDPSNWRNLNELKLLGRSKILLQYSESLSRVSELLEDKDDAFLNQTYYDPDFKGEFTYSWLLHGMLQHDVYHLGQIGYIVKFLKIQ